LKIPFFFGKLAGMKSIFYKYRFFLFFFVLIAGSCTKKVYLPDLEGNIVGYVYLLDEYKTDVLKNNSNILVKTVGMTKTYKTYTDINGRFEFVDMPAGTYEFQFQKDGYGTLKQSDIKHLGGEPTVVNSAFDHMYGGSAFILHSLPVTEITELNIEHDSLSCKISFPGKAPEAIYIQLYFSTVENFDSKSADYVITNLWLESKQEIYSCLFGPFIRQQLPFKKGEKIFFRASASPYYGQTIAISDFWSVFGIDTYFDYENNQVVYPALGKESAQYSFIFP
jgi:hypothetical protein